MKPQIEDAPGLTWRPNAKGWEARWMVRPAAREAWAKAGNKPAQSIWKGREPTASECEFIAERCRSLQAEMNTLLRGGAPEPLPARIATVRELIEAYKADPMSPYNERRHETRQGYKYRLGVLDRDIGAVLIDADIMDVRFFRTWHKAWKGDKNQIPRAQALMNMVRMLMTYGWKLQKLAACKAVKDVLAEEEFPAGEPREQRLLAEHAIAIRAKAHEMGKPSIALAQAFQFELALRQKDVIGEWVPLNEPVVSDILDGDRKWARGIRWENISDALVLKHITSKKLKEVVVDLLRSAPMVREELDRMQALPAHGPVIINEHSGQPYSRTAFRWWWRKIADEAGVPAEVCNMDSRAGAASEAAIAGVLPEHARIMLTHSDLSQTADYTRIYAEASRSVSEARAALRSRGPEKQTGNIVVYQRSTKSTTGK